MFDSAQLAADAKPFEATATAAESQLPPGCAESVWRDWANLIESLLDVASDLKIHNLDLLNSDAQTSTTALNGLATDVPAARPR